MKFNIEGGNLPVLVCELDNESVFTQAGGMCWMSGNIAMKTKSGGALGRLLTKESLFVNEYEGTGSIAFASTMPGSIKGFDVSKTPMIVQKKSFLMAESSVQVSPVVNGIKQGMFGGEGFVLQKLSGSGLAFIEVDGYCLEYVLPKGGSVTVSTGHLAAYEETVKVEVKGVKGIKNKLLGGEGLFHTVLTGPGRIYLQSMPLEKTRAILAPPTK